MWTKRSNGTNAFACWLFWPLLSKTKYLQPTTIWNIPSCRKNCHGCRNRFCQSPAEMSYTWSHTQALSSSGALPFVSFLLPSPPAPTAALINSLVLFSALLPEQEKQPPRKGTSESQDIPERAFVPEFVPHSAPLQVVKILAAVNIPCSFHSWLRSSQLQRHCKELQLAKPLTWTCHT